MWILGLFSNDRRHIILVPSVFSANAIPPIAYWIDASSPLPERAPHLFQHPSDTIICHPEAASRSDVPDDVADVVNDPDYGAVEVNPAPVPEPLPSRISRILEKSETESVALGTRAKTLARKGFIAHDEQTGKAHFVPLSDDHLKGMRMKSIFIKPGNALSWNEGRSRPRDLNTNADLDGVDDDSLPHPSKWSPSSSFGRNPVDYLREKESWAYKSRQPIAANSPNSQPTNESSVVWGPGIAESDVSSAYQKRWNRVFDWQQEHFGTDDELGRTRAPFPGLPDVMVE